MQDQNSTPGLPHNGGSRSRRLTVSLIRAYLTLIGTAALSGLALHMVRSTTAADLPDPWAQHSTLPVDRLQGPIDPTPKDSA